MIHDDLTTTAVPGSRSVRPPLYKCPKGHVHEGFLVYFHYHNLNQTAHLCPMCVREFITELFPVGEPVEKEEAP